MPESVSRRSSPRRHPWIVRIRWNLCASQSGSSQGFASAQGRERDVELPTGSTVGDVWPALELGDEPAGLLYAVNKAYAERGSPLADGDEVALIPPVSGGAFLLSEEPLSLDAVVREVASDEAGAIATFTGTARRARAAGTSSTSNTRPTRAWPRRNGGHRRRADASATS